MRSILVLVLFVSASACQCGVLDSTAHFACDTDVQCGDGYACVSVGGVKECVKGVAPTGGGGAAGGGSAGGGSAGGGSAGGGRVGGGAGGGAAGGGSAGGGSTGGGSAGGGSAGGGSAAGGSAGGGSAGGGSAGGGSAGGGSAGGGSAGGGSAGGGSAGGGSAGGGSAGGGSAGGGSAGGGGGVAGATQLAFVSAPQSVQVGFCSSLVVVQTQNAQGFPTNVSASTVVTLLSQSGQLAFFSDSNCMTGVTSVTMPAGTSQFGFYFSTRSFPMQGVQKVQVSASNLSMAIQDETITGGPDSLVVLGAPAVTLLAGTCVPLTVQSRLGTATVPVLNSTMVDLTVSPSSSHAYAEATCSTVITSVNIVAAQSSASFWVKVVSGGQVDVTASATMLLPGTATLNVQGAVRRGTCSLGPGVASTTCSVAPAQADITHTVLVFQPLGPAGSSLGNDEVSCMLISPSQISCIRNAALTSLDVSWQTLELPSGLTVTRSSGACAASIPLSPPVASGSAFVLRSVRGMGINNFDDDHMSAAFLASPSSLSFQFLGMIQCINYEAQVVQLNGANVSRGSATLGVNQTSTVVAAPFIFGGTPVVLVQGGTSAAAVDADQAPMCSYFVRAQYGAGTLDLVRGRSNQACATIPVTGRWELIDFASRANVQASVVALDVTDLSVTQTVASVDLTRTLVFFGGMVHSGLSSGESEDAIASQDLLGDSMATSVLTNPTTVTVTRATSTSRAAFALYVVEFNP